MSGRINISSVNLELSMAELDALVEAIDAKGGEGQLPAFLEVLRGRLDGARWELGGRVAKAKARQDAAKDRELRKTQNAARGWWL